MTLNDKGALKYLDVSLEDIMDADEKLLKVIQSQSDTRMTETTLVKLFQDFVEGAGKDHKILKLWMYNGFLSFIVKTLKIREERK